MRDWRDEQIKRFGRGGKKKGGLPTFEGERHHSLLLRVADQKIVDEVENRAEQMAKKGTVKVKPMAHKAKGVVCWYAVHLRINTNTPSPRLLPCPIDITHYEHVGSFWVSPCRE